MKKLALLLSLLALGALGLAACGGGDDEGNATAAKGPPDTTTEAKLSREQVQEQVQELKGKLPREQVQELKRKGFANIKAKLSREQVQELKREATHGHRSSPPATATGIWASQSVHGSPAYGMW